MKALLQLSTQNLSNQADAGVFTRSASLKIKIHALSSLIKDSLAGVTLSKKWENLAWAEVTAATSSGYLISWVFVFQ